TSIPPVSWDNKSRSPRASDAVSSADPDRGVPQARAARPVLSLELPRAGLSWTADSAARLSAPASNHADLCLDGELTDADRRSELAPADRGCDYRRRRPWRWLSPRPGLGTLSFAGFRRSVDPTESWLVRPIQYAFSEHRRRGP